MIKWPCFTEPARNFFGQRPEAWTTSLLRLLIWSFGANAFYILIIIRRLRFTSRAGSANGRAGKEHQVKARGLWKLCKTIWQAECVTDTARPGRILPGISPTILFKNNNIILAGEADTNFVKASVIDNRRKLTKIIFKNFWMILTDFALQQQISRAFIWNMRKIR